MTSPLLDIKNLRIVFEQGAKQVEAVKDISFKVEAGELVAIVGESGSGKSVTALSILQLLPDSTKISGEIRFEGTDLLSLSSSEIRPYRGKKISVIFQEPMSSLNPVYTCGAQVMEAILTHQTVSTAEAKQQTLNWFRRVQLQEIDRIFDSYPHQLSGGQKQRIMIAMAMSCQPDILIADEPTTALDVSVQSEILQVLKSLQAEEQLSIIFISHDLAVVRSIADRVLVMQQGEIVERNSGQQLFKAAQHPYTQQLLAARPPLDKKLYRLPTIGQSITPRIATEERLFPSEPILSVKNLRTWYSKKKNLWGRTTDYTKAVDDVSFDIKQGQTLGLVGESGSGKSSIGRSVLRLIPSRSGEVWFQGKNVLQVSNTQLRKMRKDIQIIFQDPFSTLNPRQSVGKAIVEPILLHQLAPNSKAAKEKALQLLEQVGLEGSHFERYPHQFSGGQRQRIAIARALALEPKLIICDECVSSLDVSIQAQVLNLLKDLQEEYQLSYLFISHDLAVVRFMSDAIIVLKDGKIVEQASSKALFETPKMAYTRELMGR